MEKLTILRRFFLPAQITSIYCFFKFGAMVSAKAEVELSRNLKLSKGVQIGSFCKIKSVRGPLEIGTDTHIASACFISSHSGGLYIGKDVLVGPKVSITASNHRYDSIDIPIRLQGQSSKGVTIGNNVWVGAASVILDGSNIGDGVIVSANSVVSGSIPPNAIVQGNPAKVIFNRR